MRGGLIGLALAVGTLAGCGPGHKAEAPARPRRVICASPAMAEIVFALGAGDRVAGVSEFSDWPPASARKPSIGGALAPNRERILVLEPDLILAQGRAEALESFARAQGVAFHAFPLDTLADLRAAIAGCAAVLGVDSAGRALLAGLERDFAALPARDPVPVFIALSHAPGDFSGLLTCGPRTFLHEIVARAGGSNVFTDVSGLWPRISREALLRRSPALILDFQPARPEAARRAALVADWERLGFQGVQVRILEEDYLLKPGPRAAQAAARIAAAIGRE